MMPQTFTQRFRSLFWLTLAALCALGAGGCVFVVPASKHVIHVDGEYRDSISGASHVGVDAMIDRWFIKRTAVVDGRSVTYYVDRSNPDKLYTMLPRKNCYGSNCDEDLFFTPVAEPLHQQLLDIEAARRNPAAQSPPPEMPSLLPDPRIVVPTLPPTPLPQE